MHVHPDQKSCSYDERIQQELGGNVTGCRCDERQRATSDGRQSVRTHWGRHLNTKISPTIRFPVSNYTVGYIVLAVIPECEESAALVTNMRRRVSNVAVVPLLRFQKGNHLPNS